MRQVKYIVIHCTGTVPAVKTEAILRYWREELGWQQVGYHYLIGKDGQVEQLADIEEIVNGALGYNYCSVHISYKGGKTASGEYKDTRTKAQKQAIYECITNVKQTYPDAVVLGHRDLPDVIKECPCFDVAIWFKAMQIQHDDMKTLEHELQKACVSWFKYSYPKALIFAIPNGGQRHKAVAAKLYDEGVLAGVPDLFIAKQYTGPFIDRHSLGLFVELKVGKNQPTKSQKEVMAKLTKAGYECAVIRSIDEFIEYVTKYME